jgi:Ring finger domain
MSSYSDYESAYGVGLLDDLHNYFPALLYGDPSAFRSVSEVLQYIQNQTRSRFDLFSRGRRQYEGAHADVPASAPAPVPAAAVPAAVPAAASPVNQRGRSSFASGRTYSQVAASTASNFPNALPAPLFPRQVQTLAPSPQILQYYAARAVAEDDEDDEAVIQRTAVQLIQNMLNMPVTTTGLTNLNQNGMTAFLEPVIVRPTPEQITQFTTVGNLSTDEDPSCAICQEPLRPEEEGRKLNACGHWFHRGCIDTWFLRDVHCPNCRHDIREPLEQAQ